MKKGTTFCLTVAIFATLFSLLMFHAHAAVEISDGSIQALYHFNASDLTDSSGNGYNGTNHGATFNTTSSKLDSDVTIY